MSDTVTTSNPSPSLRISDIPEAVIRIAGNSQDGIQAIGGFLARLAGRSEQEVMTFMTIPSTISGGPSIFQVRIGSGEVSEFRRRGGCAARLSISIPTMTT
jgi:2-oxoglutarate ferredoxin oxidoreductase subunit alpha